MCIYIHKNNKIRAAMYLIRYAYVLYVVYST